MRHVYMWHVIILQYSHSYKSSPTTNNTCSVIWTYFGNRKRYCPTVVQLMASEQMQIWKPVILLQIQGLAHRYCQLTPSEILMRTLIRRTLSINKRTLFQFDLNEWSERLRLQKRRRCGGGCASGCGLYYCGHQREKWQSKIFFWLGV